MVTPASYKSIYGIFRGRKAAETCFRALINRGLLPSEIGLMLSSEVKHSEFVGADHDEAPSEDEVLITGYVKPTIREQVVRRTKELASEGGVTANTTAVREADMYADDDSNMPNLATLVEVATPFSADGTEMLVFGLSSVAAQSGANAPPINLVAALKGLGFKPQDAERLYNDLKSNAIVISVAISDADENGMRELMLDQSAEAAFVSH